MPGQKRRKGSEEEDPDWTPESADESDAQRPKAKKQAARHRQGSARRPEPTSAKAVKLQKDLDHARRTIVQLRSELTETRTSLRAWQQVGNVLGRPVDRGASSRQALKEQLDKYNSGVEHFVCSLELSTMIESRRLEDKPEPAVILELRRRYASPEAADEGHLDIKGSEWPPVILELRRRYASPGLMNEGSPEESRALPIARPEHRLRDCIHRILFKLVASRFCWHAGEGICGATQTFAHLWQTQASTMVGVARAYYHRGQRAFFDQPAGRPLAELTQQVVEEITQYVEQATSSDWEISAPQTRRLQRTVLDPLLELHRCIREDAVCTEYDLCIPHPAQGRFCLALGLQHQQDGGSSVIDVAPICAP